MAYEVLDRPLPGVQITTNPQGGNLLVRIYKKETQSTVNRSTGCKDLEEARKWLMANFQELMGAIQTPRGGGNSSIQRLIAQHLEFLGQRQKAGEIAASTLKGYCKCGRHFLKWFSTHGFSKLGDIKRTSLRDYGISRVNDDGMSPNTVNLEIVYLKMWWKWLQETEVLSRPITVNSVQKAVENRTGGEPFEGDDLKAIYKVIDEWVAERSAVNNFGKNSVSKYNKLLFRYFIQLLDESGARQHELWNRTWKDIKVGETLTNRRRSISTVSIPQRAKRGARKSVFRGDALIEIRRLQKKMCPETSNSDFIFRSHQTNTLLSISTFSRYWAVMCERAGVSYPLHTFRSHRITQLILSGVEPQLVGRNLGLSLSQIEKTYLRFVPAAHYSKLVQDDIPQDKELRSLMI